MSSWCLSSQKISFITTVMLRNCFIHQRKIFLFQQELKYSNKTVLKHEHEHYILSLWLIWINLNWWLALQPVPVISSGVRPSLDIICQSVAKKPVNDSLIPIQRYTVVMNLEGIEQIVFSHVNQTYLYSIFHQGPSVNFSFCAILFIFIWLSLHIDRL